MQAEGDVERNGESGRGGKKKGHLDHRWWPNEQKWRLPKLLLTRQMVTGSLLSLNHADLFFGRPT